MLSGFSSVNIRYAGGASREPVGAGATSIAANAARHPMQFADHRQVELMYEDRRTCRRMGDESRQRIQRDFHYSKTIKKTLMG